MAAVLGDNVLDSVRELNPVVNETQEPVSAFGDRLIAAHAYIAADPIVDALQQGADLVITGRVGDASLLSGADGPRVLAGRRMTGTCWLKGSCWAICSNAPGRSLEAISPTRLTRLCLNCIVWAFPIAEISLPTAQMVVTKTPGSGGVVSPATCAEQMLYETDDPANYIEADVVADFSDIGFEQVGLDRVAITGKVPRQAKTGDCSRSTWASGRVSERKGTVFYAGPGAYERAKLAARCDPEAAGAGYSSESRRAVDST